MPVTLVVSLFVRPGAEHAFRRFEAAAAPVMARHGGAVERVVRPHPGPGRPDEIHLVTFPSAAALEAYRADPALASLAADRDAAILRTEIIAGDEGLPPSPAGEPPAVTAAGWPPYDPEGRPVRFTTVASRPRPDEYEPVLEGEAVRLEPLRLDHVDALAAVALDPELWRFNPSPVSTRGQCAAYARDALAARAAGTAIPFVTVERAGGRVIGSTRFGNVDARNRRMEIGWTWIARPWQRTRVNTEAKYLMLRHAFESLAAIRVELKTDSLNARSRAAILRIGARQEGVFRSHVITSEGRIRHSVYFSITAEEWPGVKARLETLLAGYAMPSSR